MFVHTQALQEVGMINPLQSSARTAADSAKIARTLAAFEVRVQMVWGFHHPAVFARDEGSSPNDIARAFKEFAIEIGLQFFSPSRRIGFPAEFPQMRDLKLWESRYDFAGELFLELANDGVSWVQVLGLAERLAFGDVYMWDEYASPCGDDCSYCNGDFFDRGEPRISARVQRARGDEFMRSQAVGDERERKLSKRERRTFDSAKARKDRLRRRERKDRQRREHEDLEF